MVGVSVNVYMSVTRTTTTNSNATKSVQIKFYYIAYITVYSVVLFFLLSFI